MTCAYILKHSYTSIASEHAQNRQATALIEKNCAMVQLSVI